MLASLLVWSKSPNVPILVSQAAKKVAPKNTGNGSRRFELADESSLTQPRLRARSQNMPWRTFWLGWFTQMQKERDFRKKEKAISFMVSQISTEEIRAALLALRSLPNGSDQEDVTIRLLRSWTAQAPLLSAAWARAIPEAEGGRLAVENVVLVWSVQDLKHASAWVRQLPAGEESDHLLSVVAGEAVRTNPEEAIRLAIGLPVSPENDALVRRATMDWAAADSQAAIAWAKQLPDDDVLKVKVLSGVVLAAAETDPLGAANLALQTLPAGRAQDDAIIGILQRWAQQSPATAAAWVDRFSAGELKSAAVENIVAIWSASDDPAAKDWGNRVKSIWQ